jgi:hypothetical protein
MTWKTFHSRGEILRAVIATANTRRDGVLPTDVEGVADAFADDLELLATLQLKWHTRLAGHIERELVNQPLDLPLAVATAWRATSEELPGVRLVIDRYRAEPESPAMAEAMAKSTVKERALLAVMAGQANVGHDAEAAPIGARIEERARAMSAASAATGADRTEREQPTFLERLRAVLAA